MIKLAKFYLVLTWTVFIYKLMTVAMPVKPGFGFSWDDKAVHLLLFGIMTALLYIFFKEWPVKKRILLLILAIFISTAYAVSIEYIQINIPGRDFSIADMSAGALGSIITAVIIYVRSTGKKT